MKNILAVLKFEYKGFVSTKSFRVITIIFIVAILILTCIPRLMGSFQSMGVSIGGEKEEDKAAIILSGEALENEVYQKAFAPAALDEAFSADWVDLSGEPFDEEKLYEDIQNNEYLFALRYSGGDSFEFFAAGNRMSSYAQLQTITDYVSEAMKQSEMADLPAETQETVEHISSIAAQPEIIDIGGNAQNNFWIGYVLIMIMFYVIMGYPQYVSSSIITEKTSKAMELLVTAVRPIHLMVGKVVGVGLAALTQVGAIVAAAAIGVAINIPYWRESNSGVLELLQGSNIDPSIIGFFLVYFIMGFFLYAFLIAALSSTVSRPEEAATVIMLPMILVMVALLIGFLTLSGAVNKTFIAVLSYIPFFTPTGMLARYTIGDADVSQMLLGVGIMAAAIIVVAIISAKIFRMGVMLYGVKVTPAQLFKALKSS